MRIVLIDNFDSFTYNIVQAYQQLGAEVSVMRNVVTLEALMQKKPQLILIGPGPGNPQGAGISKGALQMGLPVFGICLGHQAIGEAFGGAVVRAKRPMHGKTSPIYHANGGVFSGLPQGFLAARYHSLLLEASQLPKDLEVTAWTEEGEIMGVRHRELPIQGVQFHPESIASEQGLELLAHSLRV